jgi:hypothetical protein
MNHKLSMIFGTALAAALLPTPSRAACIGTHSDATVDYLKVMNTLPDSVYRTLQQQHEQRYQVSPSAWTSRGWNADPAYLKTDARSDYGKHFYGATFAEYAVHTGPKSQTVFQWDGQVALVDNTTRGFHANEDYAAIARGVSPVRQYIAYQSNVDINGWHWYPVARTSGWHLPNVHYAADGDGKRFAYYKSTKNWNGADWGIFGTFLWYSSGTRTVTTFCPLYNPTPLDPKDPNSPPLSTPAGIASSLLHEGWHSRDMDPMTDHHPQISPNAGGKCLMTDNEDGSGNCDTWYPHGKLNFEAGDTFFSSNTTSPPTNGDPNKRRPPLSANQIQIEYLCDVADSGEDWLPLSVVYSAAFASDKAVGDRFNNFDLPDYSCGLPTPMYAIAVGTRNAQCDGQARCDSKADCGPRENCSAGGCCYRDIVK